MKKSVYQQTIAVYNKLGKEYLEKSKKITPPERAPFAKLFPKGARILEVGCGGGRDTKFFVEKGLKVIGVDNSPVFIALAKKEVPKVTFKCFDLLKMKFKASTFEGIWAHAVLLHLKRKDVPKALKKFHRILKKDGVLHLSLRKGTGERYEKDKLSGADERFFTYFGTMEIKKILQKLGYKIIYFKVSADSHRRKGMFWIKVWAKKI